MVELRASSLNHHDLWSLRGVGLPADRLPMMLGCDAAGVDEDGNEVVVFPVVDDAKDPRGYPCSPSSTRGRWPSGSRYRGRNLVPKPASVSFVDAACLPTAWLTAYRMLRAGPGRPRATRCWYRGRAAGWPRRPWYSRSGSGAGLRDQPGRGEAGPDRRARRDRAGAGGTAARAGGRGDRDGRRGHLRPLAEVRRSGRADRGVGRTAGHLATVDLRRVFALQLEILGSTMGTVDELAELVELRRRGVRPVVDTVSASPRYGPPSTSSTRATCSARSSWTTPGSYISSSVRPRVSFTAFETKTKASAANPA